MNFQMTATPPNIEPNGMYRACDAIKLLGIPRATFYRYVDKGKIKSRLHAASLQRRYSGKELLRFYGNYC